MKLYPLNKPALQRTESNRSVWPSRIVNVIGASAVTLAILWESGITSRDWWDRFIASKSPVAMVLAPKRSPGKAVGIAPRMPKGNDSSLSKVPLPLMLLSVKPGRNTHEGFAEIGVVRESPQTYQVGALLENGARIEEIHSDHVLLRKGAQVVPLYLAAMNYARREHSVLLTVGGIAIKKPSSAPTKEILTDYIRPSPLYDGTRLLGFQVFAGSKPGPFDQMGLKAGDVITEVDGISLQEPQSAWEILRQIADGAVLHALVKRGDVLEQVTLDGNLIELAEAARSHIAGTIFPVTSTP